MVLDFIWVELTGMDAHPLNLVGLLDLILGEDQFGAFMLPLGS